MPSALMATPYPQVTCEYGMVHVVSETGGPKGKDYCILYNPQWAHLPHDLGKAVSTACCPRGWGPHPCCSPQSLRAPGGRPPGRESTEDKEGPLLGNSGGIWSL